MLKIQFTNAEVEDNGYGLKVNGKDLDGIISTALGTKAGSVSGYGSGLPSFHSNSCDVTIIINPHPTEVRIEDDKNVYNSVEDLEEDKANELNNKKDAEADPEE